MVSEFTCMILGNGFSLKTENSFGFGRFRRFGGGSDRIRVGDFENGKPTIMKNLT